MPPLFLRAVFLLYWLLSKSHHARLFLCHGIDFTVPKGSPIRLDFSSDPRWSKNKNVKTRSPGFTKDQKLLPYCWRTFTRVLLDSLPHVCGNSCLEPVPMAEEPSHAQKSQLLLGGGNEPPLGLARDPSATLRQLLLRICSEPITVNNYCSRSSGSWLPTGFWDRPRGQSNAWPTKLLSILTENCKWFKLKKYT